MIRTVPRARALLLGVALSLFANGARAATPPVVAVLPPSTDQQSVEWVGLMLADEIESRLLEHLAFDSKKRDWWSPISVFGWRQTVSAARGAKINPKALLSASEGEKIAKTLGATAVFTGTYSVKSSSVRLLWRLVGPTASPHHDVELPLDNLAQAMARLYTSIIFELKLHTLGVPIGDNQDWPFSALSAYGRGLEILAEQSLDPRAKQVLPQARVVEAHLLLSEATHEAPTFGRAWVWRAIASVMAGDKARSNEELAQAQANLPAGALQLSLASYYQSYRLGDLEQAIVRLGTGLDKRLGFLQGLGYLGQAYLRAGKINEALHLFTLFRDRVPNNAWVEVMRADCLVKLGKQDEALTTLRALHMRFSKDPLVTAALADRLREAKRFDEARGKLAAALVDEPNDPILQARLGHVLALLGHKDEAIEMLLNAKRLGVDKQELERVMTDTQLAELRHDPRLR